MKASIWSWVVTLSVFLSSSLQAKTLTLTDEDADRMAQIAAQSPLSSWAGSEIVGGVWYNGSFDLTPQHAFLIRFPLDEIPKDQKITKAELTFQVSSAPGEQKILIRRIVGTWGAGVSWKYRQTNGKKVEWAAPGAKAGSKDRVTKPTAIAKVSGPVETTVNLTEDVELWYAKAANNEGWLFTIDAPDGFVRVNSPTWTVAGSWKLRITYEPK
jgi:hypothetical protein